MKNAFNGFTVDWIHITEKRLGKNEDMSIEISQTKMQRKRTEYSRICGTITKGKTYVYWEFQKKKKEKKEQKKSENG